MQSIENKCQSCRSSDICEDFTLQQTNVKTQQNPQHTIIYLKCTQCLVIQCRKCFKEHLQQTHIQSGMKSNRSIDSLFEVICQQCEQNDSIKFCQNCEQHLCDKCSFRIHNKGKRAKHHLLNNDILLKIQKLFFYNQNQTEDLIQSLAEQYNPSNCLIVYTAKRPSFIEDFEGLQIQDLNKLTIEQIESCLNRYPLISTFSVNEVDQGLTQLLMSLNIEQDFVHQEDECSQNFTIFINGFKISLQIRTKNKQFNKSNQGLFQQQQYDKVDQSSSQNQNYNLFSKSNTEISSPQGNKFRKKESIDFSCGSKEECQPIPQMHKLFKKALKMSNRSLIIEIPQAKQYKQSPIKSDRQQGFIERNLNLLENATKNQRNDKTLTINLDQNYHDISGSTMNILEQSECKSNNQQSILMMGSIHDCQKDQSFKIIGNQPSYSELGNSIEEQDNIASFSVLNAGSISLSTDNSIRKRSKKLPIPYFQPMKSKNVQSLNNSYGYMFTEKARFKLQKKFRQMAQSGILMVNKQKLDQFNLKFDQKIIKKMKKNVCDKQIEYYSLNLQTISIQSITWVLESIKEDRMMPSQKLVLSRLKQSFNIKPAHKLWICIMKYFETLQYQTDKQQYNKHKLLPTIVVGKFNDQILLEYQEKWSYEDHQKPLYALEEWEMFKLVLNEYFKKNKQIAGGRYGCVQYVKLNGPHKLKQCSLGRLSYFVQEAIDNGLIRYHKTLLIQNNQFLEKAFHLEKNNMKLFDMQKQLKITIIQVALIDIFLQTGVQTQISLAQLPLTFKKMILFDVNLLELGFPKLKNILQTLTDKLVLSSSKSHIKYQSIKNNQKIQQMRMKLQQLMQYFISQTSDVISSCMLNRHNMIVNQLYNLTNQKLGFIFDFRVCNVPDFYQFLIYYCHQIINLQFINGTFVAFPKHMGYMGYQYQNNQNNFYQSYPYGNNQNPNYYFNPQVTSGVPGHMFNQYEKNCQFNLAQGIGSNMGASMNYQNNYPNNYHMPGHPHQPYGNPTYQNIDLNSKSRKTESYQSQPYNYSQQFNQPQTNYHQGKIVSSIQTPMTSQISTPKFNQSIEYINKKTNIKTLQNFKWESYLDVIGNFEDGEDKHNNFETQSFTDYQSIYNILDDQNQEVKSKLSLPKTFIEKQGSCNNNQELYISKITPIDQKSDNNEDCDQSLGLFDQSPPKDSKNHIYMENSKNGRKQKGQHTRVYSTTEARTKHERMYSTTTAKN